MAKETQPLRDDRPAGEPVAGAEPWVRCAACGHSIARAAARIDVDGKHLHTFVNPQGEAFTIACFADAPGCRGSGEESTFWSWFPGHAWRMALCGACGAQVGWSFRREGAMFWGFIVERIV